jgi:hypothetical protein
MTTSGQIFIYKAFGITPDNNFPLIEFESKQAYHDFVLSLVSTNRKSLVEDEPYFVLNNPQLLPDSVRRKHKYKVKVTRVAKEPIREEQYNELVFGSKTCDYSEDCSDSSDDEHETYIEIDGCFRMKDNIELLIKYQSQIKNNTNMEYGFYDYVSNCSELFLFCE